MPEFKYSRQNCPLPENKKHQCGGCSYYKECEMSYIGFLILQGDL